MKLFFLTLSISLTTFFSLAYYSNYSKEREVQIEAVTSLTKLPGLALSTAYLEHRVIYYRDDSNRLYPQMKNDSKMNYVYAK